MQTKPITNESVRRESSQLAIDTPPWAHFLPAVALLLLLVTVAPADQSPDIQELLRRGQQINHARLSSVITNAGELGERMMRAYDARHPTDLWIETLSVKDLQKLARSRTNDLEPRLVLLQRELSDDRDCEAWLVTLKEGYALCTSDQQKVICLVAAMGSTFRLEGEQFGRAMLADMEKWLKGLSDRQPTGMVAEKIRFLRLFAGLGLKAYAEVPGLAQGTPFRSLTPLWMMSKGKWDLALKEVVQLKQLPDLDKEEKSMIEAFEPLLRGMTKPKE